MVFDIGVITAHASEVITGFGTTLWTTVVACFLAMGFGLIVAQGLLAKSIVIRYPIRLYVETIRTTPFLVQLFLLYYGGPTVGINLEPLEAGILGLAIYGSAYYAEIFRAGFNSIPHGQLEVAQMLGFSHGQTLWRIQLPQMMGLILPALVNTSIFSVKRQQSCRL